MESGDCVECLKTITECHTDVKWLKKFGWAPAGMVGIVVGAFLTFAIPVLNNHGERISRLESKQETQHREPIKAQVSHEPSL